MSNEPTRILVTGALGQLGSELLPALRADYGPMNVIATDLRAADHDPVAEAGPFTTLDVTDRHDIERVVSGHRIDGIFHLAALLSAKGEQDPVRCWQVNVDGLRNVLDVARERNVARVFVPSSIAVFGASVPKDDTPQQVALEPSTMYGITKATAEVLGAYYGRRYDLDVRGLRYPGLISSETKPGGGTTDYAVEIFYAAVQDGSYTCFVGPDTTLPMMYMSDAVLASIQLFHADRARLRHPTSYNIGAMSFSAAALAKEIQRHLPEFRCTYEPDYRQAIADNWPHSVDDSAARRDWGWSPRIDLEEMTDIMLERLSARLVR